jgi:Cu(I)/Ag(I) efflux system membrane protein CusA/SilA
MVGGMVSATLLTLVVIPAIYSLWKEWELTQRLRLAGTERLPRAPVEPPAKPALADVDI